MNNSSFLDTVESTIQQYRMLKPQDRVLVGVSAGPDSAALLTALVAIRPKLALSLRAIYVDHAMRSRTETAREEAWVKAFGKRLGVPVSILRAAVRPKKGRSLEEIAREARYGLFSQCARRFRMNVLAVGHTQDDQAETVLLWILRGAGTTGLAGIPPVRELEKVRLRIVRPLLQVSRKEVEDFLAAHGIRALEDRTNRSLRFLRNRIRRRLIPFLEKEYNPQLRRHLAKLASIVRRDLESLRLHRGMLLTGRSL